MSRFYNFSDVYVYFIIGSVTSKWLLHKFSNRDDNFETLVT